MLGLVHRDVLLRELLHCPCELYVALDRGGVDARDDERRPRLVDEDGVHVIHDREGVSALHALVRSHDHMIAQVVEAELAVGAVGYVSRIGRFLAVELHVVLQAANAHAQKAVDLAHPLAVALGEVVVHRDDVDALAGDGVQVGRERGDEGLPLATFHLGDHAPVQDDAAHELHGEVPHPEGTPGGLPHGGEGLREQFVELLSPLVALPKVLGHATQLLVRHGLEVVRKVFDLAGYPLELLLAHALAHREGMRKQTLLSRRTHPRSSRLPLKPARTQGDIAARGAITIVFPVLKRMREGRPAPHGWAAQRR